MSELQAELQRLSGTKLDAAGAANALAGTTGLELVGALNAYAGTAGREFGGVIREISGGAETLSGVEAGPAPNGGEPTGNVLYLDLPGTSGNYASTPDTAAVSITSDIDMRMKLAMTNWASVHGFACKYGASGQISWRWYNAGAGGRPQFDASQNGSSELGHLASTGAGFVNGTTNWLRFTWRNSDNVSTHYTSTDGSSWTQLGTTATGLNFTGLFDSTAPLVLGAGVSAGNSLNLNGDIYYFELRNGIDGPVVAKFNPGAVTKSTTRTPTTYTAPTGEVWTVNGAAWDWATP